MKKLLTLVLGVVMLVAFAGLSAAQEKKPATPAAIPKADSLALTNDPSKIAPAGKPCPVIARPWCTLNSQWIYPGQPVKFVKVPGGQVLFQGITNAKGVLPWTVPTNTTVRAEITGIPPLVSTNFTCVSFFPAK